MKCTPRSDSSVGGGDVGGSDDVGGPAAVDEADAGAALMQGAVSRILLVSMPGMAPRTSGLAGILGILDTSDIARTHQQCGGGTALSKLELSFRVKNDWEGGVALACCLPA